VGVQIVGSVLVRNEERFVRRAIENVASFCDRIHAFDHVSDDGTWEILRSLARELDHLDVRRTRHAADSHRPLEHYAGTATWVLGVDGDELFDPAALPRLREALLAGEHADVFRLKGHVLNCDALDLDERTASGFMAPPSRPVTKLFNLAAVGEWSGASERLHDGHPVFRGGYDWQSLRYLSESSGWAEDPLRCLHVCFLRRSGRDDNGRRPNLNETGRYDRTLLGALKRRLRGPNVPPDVVALHGRGTDWKSDWYTRGERVTVDASPFLGETARAKPS
jgi:hypothetical protein